MRTFAQGAACQARQGFKRFAGVAAVLLYGNKGPLQLFGKGRPVIVALVPAQKVGGSLPQRLGVNLVPAGQLRFLPPVVSLFLRLRNLPCKFLVLPLCLRQLILQGGFTVRLRAAVLTESHIVQVIQGFQAGSFVTGSIFYHRHTGFFQLFTHSRACIVGHNGRLHLIKANSPPGLGFKIFGRQLGGITVQHQQLLGSIGADAIALFRKNIADSRSAFLPGSFHNNAANNIGFFKRIVRVGFCLLLDFPNNRADLVVHRLHLCFIALALRTAQAAAVLLHGGNTIIAGGAHALQAVGS